MTTSIVKFNSQMPTLPNDAPLGYEGVDPASLPIPRLDLLQAKSSSVEAGNGKAGTMVNSVTGEVYSSGEQFIFVKYSRGAIYFDKDTEKLVCKSNNGEANTNGEPCEDCPHGVFYKTWSADNKPNKCVEQVNLLGVRRASLLTSPDVAVVSFKVTSFSAGMKIISAAALKNKPIYLWAYELHTEQKAKYKNVYVYNPVSVGYVTNEELAALIKIANQFGDKTIEASDDLSDQAAPEAPKQDFTSF